MQQQTSSFALGVPYRSQCPVAPARSKRPSLFLQRDLNDEALTVPPEPVFSDADIAAARQEGFDEGHAAGLATAAACREAEQARAIETIAVAMTDAREAAGHVSEHAADALSNALLAALRAVMPEMIRRSALNEIGAMLEHVLPGLSREPEVRIEVPCEIASAVARSLATLAPELHERITVADVHHLGAGEAKVIWAAGQARRQPDRIWRDIMDALWPGPAALELEGQ